MALLGQRATGKSALLKEPDSSCCDVCDFSRHRDVTGYRDVPPHPRNVASATATHGAVPGEAAAPEALGQIRPGDDRPLKETHKILSSPVLDDLIAGQASACSL